MQRPCLTTSDAVAIAGVSRQAILKAEKAGTLDKVGTAKGLTYYDADTVTNYAKGRGVTLSIADVFRIGKVATLRAQTLGSLFERRRLAKECRLADDRIGKLIDGLGQATTCQVVEGDCLDSIRAMPANSVHCCVTSPPYFGLRDYKHKGQIGQEKDGGDYINALVAVFREVRRVLRQDGTLWLNLGDCYGPGKQMQAIPWRVALALQADGWVLRQDIIWSKPAPMPESVKDRCTRAHEFVFMLSKGERYFYNSEAIAIPHTEVSLRRWGGGGEMTGQTKTKYSKAARETGVGNLRNGANPLRAGGANRKSVWTIPADANKMPHLAPMPAGLAELCILAGCPENGTVLDPFGGSGTSGAVARDLGRNAILCELNPEYAKIARERVGITQGE